MNMVVRLSSSDQYARCIKASRSVRWDIDADVIRGRSFDAQDKFLPDGLCLAAEFPMLDQGEKRLMSQIQGRTYANMFGLVERFINAKVLELGRDHALGDQTALEALMRFSEEELKHQELFRRIEVMIGGAMPAGYRFDIDPDAVAGAVLGAGSWAVLALTLHIELFTQAHYRESIADDGNLSPLFKDVFLFHWKEESQHAILDELELRRCHASLEPAELDRGVDAFIALVGAVDGLLRQQAMADAAFLADMCGRDPAGLADSFLKAYRWQYILSGAGHPRFQSVMKELVTPAQMRRIGNAVAMLQDQTG